MEKQGEGEKKVLKMSEKLEGLLIAYNLCKASAACHNTLKEHLCEGLFKAGMCEYFRQYNNLEERETLLKKFKEPEVGDRVLINETLEVEDWTTNTIGERLEGIFREQETIWKESVIGRAEEYEWVGTGAWMEIPKNVGGEETGKGIPYVFSKSGGVSAPEKKRGFIQLIEATIDIEWRDNTWKVSSEESP